jgi:hypothetical protein
MRGHFERLSNDIESKDTIQSIENTFDIDFPHIAHMMNEQNHPFHDFIDSYILKGELYPKPGVKISRATYLLALIFGSISGVPWAQPAYDLTGGGWGYFFGACWVWNRVIKDLLQKTSPQEKQLIANSFCKRKSGLIARQLLSSANAITSSYTAYKYNSIRELSFVVLVDSYAFSYLGFKYFFHGLNKIKSKFVSISPFEKEKNKLLFQINQTYQHILKMDNETRISFLNSLHNLKQNQVSPIVYMNELLSNISTESEDDASYYKWWVLGNFIALAIVSISFAVDIILGQEGSENFISDITWLNIIISIVLNLPELALRILSSLGTVNDVVYRNSNDNIATTFYPKVSKFIPYAAFLISIPTSAGPFHIISNVLSGAKDGKYVFALIGAIQEIIYETFLLRKLGHLFIETIAMRMKNPNINRVLILSDELELIEKALSQLDKFSTNSNHSPSSASVEEQRLIESSNLSHSWVSFWRNKQPAHKTAVTINSLQDLRPSQ